MANAALIRRKTSIPTAALAAKRFEVGVLSAVTDWLAAGLLSDIHVAMVLTSVPADMEPRIRDSLSKFRFSDPWSRAGLVSLEAAVVALDLAGFASLDDVFLAVADRPDRISSLFPEDAHTANKPETWYCTEADD